MQAANNAPIYAACLYPELSEFMRTKGWALAVHGSLARDFDLVAIPWHPDPVAPEKCVEGICHYWAFKSVGKPETRLHGRLIYTIALKFGECFLDLSFMPTTPNVQIEPPSRLLAKVGSNAGLGVAPGEARDGSF